MKSGCRSCALAAASSSALGISRRKITHTSTSIWAMPVRSSAPIALRYSVSIRAWAHTKLIRQIVLSVTWTEKDALYSLDPSAPVSDCLSNSISSHMDGSHERGPERERPPDYSRAPPATPRKDATVKIVVMGDANADWRWVEVAYFPEISGSCKPPSYRDTKVVATEAAGFLKNRHPHSEVTVKDLQSGEVTAAIYRPEK